LTDHDLSADPWGACNVEVNPGIYRLRLELPPHKGEEPIKLDQTIVALSSWQTQIFLLQRNYGADQTDRRADLAGASILLSRGPGFDHNRNDFRQTELARLGLTNQRLVVSEELRAILRDKLENPMLGIFAAHLLLLNKEPDLALLQTVVTNLRNLLMAPHPDVEALALRFEPSASYVFQSPPMLRRSWSLIVNATAARPDLVPLGSPAGRIWDRLWEAEPWLLWMPPEEGKPGVDEGVAATAEAPPGYREVEAVLQSQLLPQARPAGRLSKATSPFAAVATMRSAGTEIGQPGGAEAPSAPASVRDVPGGIPQPQLDETKIRMLVEALGIPQASLREILSKVYSKMTGAGGISGPGDESGKT